MPHHPERRTALFRRTFSRPLSLRAKLLIGFSIAFSIVLAGSSIWFYRLTTHRILNHLRADMRIALQGTAAHINVDELAALYQQGQRNTSGFSSDPRYLSQLTWFETVQSIQSHVWLYTYVVGPAQENRRIGAATTAPDQLEIVYLVDLWANHDRAKAAQFLESEPAGQAAYQVYRTQSIYESPAIYHDRWGGWLSTAMPLKMLDNGTFLVLGLDVEANYILHLQGVIRQQILITVITAYAVLFVLIYVLSGVLTNRVSRLTRSAELIGQGDYSLNLSPLTHDPFPDEMTTLAHVFEGMVGSIRTRERLIREGKQVEYEMRLALQQERELNELKSRFVSMVSHELRTPLTVIRTSLELLECYGDRLSADKQQQYFERSRVAIETMTHMLEDVLTIGKAEAGKLDVKPLWLNVEQFCRDLVQELTLADGGNHAIHIHTVESNALMWLDPTLLRSILTNLLSNAIKYSTQGTAIDFSVACEEHQVIFTVQDHGIGIPKADQPRLFDLFHRASNVKTIRGTGLGLAIVKQCVAAHNGQVKFASVEGEGTTFTITIPHQPAEAVAPIKPPPSPNHI